MAVHGGLIQPSDAPPTSRSEALFARAKTLMPGGVSSPVRAFRSVGGTPRFISRAQGPYLWDADGHRYVDFVLSWGPMILGHAHPEVVEAVRKQVVDGMSFARPARSRLTSPSGSCGWCRRWRWCGSSRAAPRPR